MIEDLDRTICPICKRGGSYSYHGTLGSKNWVPMVLVQCQECRKNVCGACWCEHYEQHYGKPADGVRMRGSYHEFKQGRPKYKPSKYGRENRSIRESGLSNRAREVLGVQHTSSPDLSRRTRTRAR